MRQKKFYDFILLDDKMTRHGIVQKVVNTFISTECSDRGQGIQFWYPVENLSDNKRLFIKRPGGLQKWNFDFKVNVEPEFELGKGTHKEVALDFQNKKIENPQKYPELLKALTQVYNCNNDVDQILQAIPDLEPSFKTGAKANVLLKVIKWMFIMEDIVYWNYKGRTKLYDYLMGL
jgi:hypothetical protein